MKIIETPNKILTVLALTTMSRNPNYKNDKKVKTAVVEKKTNKSTNYFFSGTEVLIKRRQNKSVSQ